MTVTPIATAAPGRPPHRRSRLLAAGVLAGPLFVVTFLVEGVLRDAYDPIRHPVSSLALGPSGWVQVLNFLVTGLLALALAAGLRRSLRPGPGWRWGPILVGVWAVGLIGAGVFVTDPVSGYPPGTPAQPQQPSWHGILHDLVFSLPAFIALAAACFVMARAFGKRRAPAWAAFSALSGIAFLVFFFLASAGFSQAPGLVATAGLWQRLAVAVGWLWLTALAVRERHADAQR
jgi:hypothetical protein